jgi:hypothetical protein
VNLQPGDEVSLKHSGRRGVVLKVEKPRATSALVTLEGDTTIVVASENLELSGVRDPVKSAVNRRLRAYYAGESVCL